MQGVNNMVTVHVYAQPNFREMIKKKTFLKWQTEQITHLIMQQMQNNHLQLKKTKNLLQRHHGLRFH